MSDKQPEALRLADEMAKAIFPKLCLIDKATDELRRLHEVNQELVNYLKGASNYIDKLGGNSRSYRAALAKAQGESNEH